MKTNLNSIYNLISPKTEINSFLNTNPETSQILNAIEPELIKHFPSTEFSLEICDNLTWTTESKLLVNVHVTEVMFFNEVLTHFKGIYHEIEPLIEDSLCPIVLFPNLENEKYDKLNSDSAINLIARTAYFNNDFEENFQREMTLREIPKEEQINEIIEYCKSHENPNISDMVFDLQLDLFDVDRIIDELEEDGLI